MYWKFDQPSLQRGRGPLFTAVALGAILLLALGFRLTGLDWDRGQHLHPDERFLTIVETSISWPSSINEYFDSSRSPLNPYRYPNISFFVYGTFPLFLVKAFGTLTGYSNYDTIHLVGRVLSAIFDVGTVLILFLISRRLFDHRVALLSALLGAVSVLSIQLSHFFTVDTFATFFVTAALYLTLRIYTDQRWLLFIGLGLVTGLALASKLSSAFVVLFVITYLSVRLIRDYLAGRRRPRWQLLVAGLLVSGLVSALTFRITQPYAFSGVNILDFRLAQDFLNAVNQQRQIQEGTYDWPPGIQWASTLPYLFPLKNIVLWGLGFPLGLAALASLIFASYRLVVRNDWPLLLPVLWIGLYFIYFGALVLKTMRYYHPIYPMLVMLVAWLLFYIWDNRQRARLLGRCSSAVGTFLCVAVVLGSVVWSLAFTSIYTRPATRITASEWIYATIPAGSTIATEHWDDALPLSLPGFGGSQRYRMLQLPLYDDDTQSKREQLIEALNKTDFVVLSSNRLSESIPRMPQRYPMTSRYYAGLSSGALGFDQVAQFTSYPSFAGFDIVDDSAEEAFTVYDHPKVRIYQKTDSFDMEAARSVLEAVDLSRIARVLPRDAGNPNLLFSARDWERVRATGSMPDHLSERSIFNENPALFWILLMVALSISSWPLASLALSRLPDAGYFVARPIGLLLLVYPAWLLGSFRWFPFGRGTLLTGMAILLCTGVFLGWCRRRRLMQTIKSKWPALLIGEVVFLASFLFLLFIRMANPDLWHSVFGGEKPMDFTHLNAIFRTSYFPPYDPWWAGGYINYYYFGQLLTAGPALVLGIQPSVAYNLGLTTMFAITAAVIFSIGFNLWNGVGRKMFSAIGIGVLGVFLTLFLGNLDSLIQLFQIAVWRHAAVQMELPFILEVPRVLLGGTFSDHFDFWRSTRVIEHTVNEFPYFTFLYGDLHPHLINLGWTLVTLSAVVALVLARPALLAVSGGSSPWHYIRVFTTSEYRPPLLLIAISLGVHRVSNPWDFPTYLSVSMLALFYSLWRASGRVDRNVVMVLVLSLGFLIGFSFVLFVPFHTHFGVFFGGLIATPDTTALYSYLVLFGTFFLILFSFAVLALSPLRMRDWYSAGLALCLTRPGKLVRYMSLANLRGRWRQLPGPWIVIGLAIVVTAIVTSLMIETGWSNLISRTALIMIGLVIAGYWILGLRLIPPVPWILVVPTVLIVFLLIGEYRWSTRVFQPVALGLALTAALHNRHEPIRFIPMALLAGAILLTVVPEWYALRGDVGRLNTVFKSYYQAWIMLAIASTLVIPQVTVDIVRRFGGWFRLGGALLLLTIAVSIFGSALYPFGATHAKLDLRIASTDLTLDGRAYMEDGVIVEQDLDIELRYDKQAIDWILANIKGRPVILEATVDVYRWGSRVSTNTGLPTVLGWDWHEKQQRWPYRQEVDLRRRDVELAYTTTSIDDLYTVLDRYDIDLIYVGALERAYYPAAGLAKFDRLNGGRLEMAYRNRDVSIYRVIS